MTVLPLEPLSDGIGADITGVDVTRVPADTQLAAAIVEALEHHGVLVIRDAHLEPDLQVQVCEALGQVDYAGGGHHEVPGIYRVTLDTSKNSSAEYLRATFDWHIDGCTPLHGEYPQMATVLSAKATAETGGETEFASTYGAYADLSPAEQATAEQTRVVHTLAASQRRYYPTPTEEQLARWDARPRSEHPLVWTHRDGRKSLVIGASADYVVGMGREAGAAFLDGLLDRATAPGRVYRHSWTVGDTVIWDNRGVLHRALPYAATSEREMLRTTILGDEPIS